MWTIAAKAVTTRAPSFADRESPHHKNEEPRHDLADSIIFDLRLSTRCSILSFTLFLISR